MLRCSLLYETIYAHATLQRSARWLRSLRCCLMAVMPPSPSTQFGAPLFKPDHGHPLPSQCDVFRQQMMMHQRHLALQKQRGLVSKQFGLIAQRDVLSPSSCVHRQKAVGWNRILEAGLDKPGALSEDAPASVSSKTI